MNAPLAFWPPKRGKERFLSRRFTDEHVDLDIDFNLSRPELVTSLLASCLYQIEGNNVDAQSAWGWTVSERLQGLLALAHASSGDSTIAVAISAMKTVVAKWNWNWACRASRKKIPRPRLNGYLLMVLAFHVGYRQGKINLHGSVTHKLKIILTKPGL